MKLAKLIALCLVLVCPLHALVAQEKLEFKETVQLDGIKKGKVLMEMPAGVMHVKAQSNALAEANILYSRANWKPQLSLKSYKQAAELHLKQPEIKNSNGTKSDENKWSINLSKSTPLDLEVKFGAGESTLDLRNSKVEKLTLSAGAAKVGLDLRGSQVRELEVNAGVGELTLDLRGNWSQDLQVELSSGIGNVKLLLPKDTGVRLTRSGMGSFEAGGLRKEGNHYTNQTLGKSKHTLSINVSGGLGGLSVTQE